MGNIKKIQIMKLKSDGNEDWMRNYIIIETCPKVG